MCAGGKLIEALLKRALVSANSGVYAPPVGISHIFWACANLKTCAHHVRPPYRLPALYALASHHLFVVLRLG